MEKFKQACFTHMFDWEFETKKEYQMRVNILSSKRSATLSQCSFRRMYKGK